MALEHNKSLKITKEQISAAESMQRAAFVQHLPSFSATGAYIHNSRNVSLLHEDKFVPVGTRMQDGSFGFTRDQINNNWTTINGTDVPLDADGNPFNPKLNPEKIDWKGYAYLPKDEFILDTRNIFVGGVSMVQPVYMGGKIRELNKIAGYGKDLAVAQQEGESSELIYNVDAAYWQVVSITNKLKLVEQFKALVEKLNNDVQEMVNEGVVTQSDLLKVRVKLNEAELNILKAQNGVNLSKMNLSQLIGLPMETEFGLADEQVDIRAVDVEEGTALDDAFTKRPELKQLMQLSNISKSNVKVMQSRFLPNIGLTAGYLVSNPNPYNGLVTEFGGAWNVGVAVSMPIFHWGERVHTLKVAKSEHRISEYKLEEAKEKIELQVRQSTYKIKEANKRLSMTEDNLESATENMRIAEEGHKGGVIVLSNLMEAQTAWQAANAERIDAAIDAKLCEVYLKKATGNLH